MLLSQLVTAHPYFVMQLNYTILQCVTIVILCCHTELNNLFEDHPPSQLLCKLSSQAGFATETLTTVRS
jgi:hypothetical protein